jgi:hypothetical protein
MASMEGNDQGLRILAWLFLTAVKLPGAPILSSGAHQRQLSENEMTHAWSIWHYVLHWHY